jgi:uncharacterized membrane-anchored protein
VEARLRALHWHKAGEKGSIDGKAVFVPSDKYTFLGSQDTDEFLKINGNPPPGNSYTIASTESNWFGILSFAPEGYVKDDEKIDADALLISLKEQNRLGAEQRRKAGYPVLLLQGWAIAPRYDTANRRLEWGTLVKDEQSGRLNVNVSTKILGRSGFTSAVLVTSPETVEQDLADFKVALGSFSYIDGEKYSDWKQGDKVAAYGLGALVLGGAAAVASSKGGLKALLLALAGGVAALWAFVKRFFLGRKKASTE